MSEVSTFAQAMTGLPEQATRFILKSSAEATKRSAVFV